MRIKKQDGGNERAESDEADEADEGIHTVCETPDNIYRRLSRATTLFGLCVCLGYVAHAGFETLSSVFWCESVTSVTTKFTTRIKAPATTRTVPAPVFSDASMNNEAKFFCVNVKGLAVSNLESSLFASTVSGPALTTPETLVLDLSSSSYSLIFNSNNSRRDTMSGSF